jgi:hypothetical protein
MNPILNNYRDVFLPRAAGCHLRCLAGGVPNRMRVLCTKWYFLTS